MRVDVALADASQLHVGQRAEISSDVLPQVQLSGIVTRIEGQADLNRNTLQAKVSIPRCASTVTTRNVVSGHLLCGSQPTVQMDAEGQQVSPTRGQSSAHSTSYHYGPG